MDKSNFKKLALMGITGAILASQSPVSAHVETKGTTIAGGCGSKGGCGGYRGGSNDNLPAYFHQGNSNRNGCGASRRYTADAQTDMHQQQFPASGRVITEAELRDQLTFESREVYDRLSPEGKALALRFANQGQDRNQAVRLAAQQLMNRSTNVNPTFTDPSVAPNSYRSTGSFRTSTPSNPYNQ